MYQKLKQEKYGRGPDSVLYDVGLSHSAFRIYVMLARHVYQGSTARLGQRLIAKRLGMSPVTVNAGLSELAERGHVTVIGEGRARRMYRLHSDVFGRKQRDGVDEIISSPSKTPRYASLRTA